MSDATDAILDIVEAITDYGSSITLKVITEGTYNTATGETTDTTVSVATKAIPRNYSGREIDNVNVYSTDMKFMLYYNGLINYSDKIVFDGKTYKLINIDKTILQDTNILYTIQGRT